MTSLTQTTKPKQHRNDVTYAENKTTKLSLINNNNYMDHAEHTLFPQPHPITPTTFLQSNHLPSIQPPSFTPTTFHHSNHLPSLKPPSSIGIGVNLEVRCGLVSIEEASGECGEDEADGLAVEVLEVGCEPLSQGVTHRRHEGLFNGLCVREKEKKEKTDWNSLLKIRKTTLIISNQPYFHF